MAPAAGEVNLEDLNAELQMAGGNKEVKPVLYFANAKKKLVLNKTNAKAIAKLHGSAAEGWAGKQVVLYPTTTRCGRDVVDCVRVR
jgi:phosphopantetheine adenylyltransferase